MSLGNNVRIVNRTDTMTKRGKLVKAKIFILMLCLAVLAGCATTDDLRRLQGEYDQKLGLVNERIGTIDGKIAALEQRSAAENATLRADLDKNGEAIASARKNMADTDANINDVRDSVHQLRGQVETMRKDLNTSASRSGRREDESKELRDKLNTALFKINFIESFLGIGKKEDQPEAAEKGTNSKDAVKGKPDKESVYAAAYELFKDGKFDKSREAFQNFLKQYPDTEYSDNAQFWIGECYFFEKKYENAILEYEKVAKNYPSGDKVPNALLKEGISFLNLGDKTSAKLVLERVIRDYPNTNPARTAKATLLNIK